MTCTDYRTLYGNGPLLIYTDEQKKRASEKQKAWISVPENKTRYKEFHRSIWQEKYWIEKGHTAEQAKELVSKKQTRVFRDETKALLSSQRVGDKNSMSTKSVAAREGVSLAEARKLAPCYGRTKEKHPMFGKHHTEESKNKIAANTPVTFYNSSKAEIELKQFLLSKGFQHNTHVAIGPYNVDVLLAAKKMVIEYFGDYWHANPKIYSADKYISRLKKTAQEQWQKDQKKVEYLKKQGYKVFVVWENDWKRNNEATTKEIENAINQ